MANLTQINAFINLIASAVQQSCKDNGWGVPSAIIAQAGIESAWGTSKLWLECFNGWGMKWVNGCGCDYKTYSTKEQRSDGTYYTIQAAFRKYPDVPSGINGYFQFINAYKRYIPVKNAKTYTEYANQLKACGWATSLAYANSIINTVTKYGLTKYDDLDFVDDLSRFYCPGITYTTQANLFIREEPNGNKVKFDSITSNAKDHAHFDDYGNAVLDKDTRVTCLETKVLNNNVWLRIPSGWICAINNNCIYIS